MKLGGPISQQFEEKGQDLMTNPQDTAAFAQLITSSGQQASAAGFPQLASAYVTIANDLHTLGSDETANNTSGVQADSTKLQTDIQAIEKICGL